MRRSLLILAILSAGGLCRAQADSVANTVEETARPVISYSSGDTVKVVKSEHSPNRALMLSILPGAGQVYNRQAWKISIIYAALGGVGYYCYFNYTNMAKFKAEYLYRQQHGGATSLADYRHYPTANIYNMYESYNKYFQLSLFGLAAVYGLNLIDAYVFGHLFDFELNDDLSMRMSPALSASHAGTLAAGFSISLEF